jgi:hypothetical protein
MAALDARDAGQGTRLTGLAKLLSNVAAGWEMAHPAQRNRMAQLLFGEVVVNGNRVEAVKPRPELAGFFLLDYLERMGLSHMYRTSGPDEDRLREFRTSMDSGLRIRVSAFPSHYPIRRNEPSPALTASQRTPRIDPSCWPDLMARSKHESLRDLATGYHVSHETIRRVLERHAKNRA